MASFNPNKRTTEASIGTILTYWTYIIMAAAKGVGPVKVVIINTQYVETDSRSFKSVVQRLTGKDSKIEDFESSPEKPRLHSGSVPAMSRGLSFKDFDKLFKELPPLEELYRLYADN